jgi:hypothetical protein
MPSALDDMLHTMQEQDYDITGLESMIKEDWEPGREEGDGNCYYHFGIVFKYREVEDGCISVIERAARTPCVIV